MVGSDIDGYTARFHKLARLVPHMVTLENQRVKRYIRGLAPEIKPHVTSSKPTTIQSVVSIANRLTTNGIKDGTFKKKENAGNKRSLNDQNMDRGGNRPNPLLAIEGNPNLGNNQNRAQGRAFGLGVAEAPHDPNIVMGTFSLNDHFAIVLFDYGADYSFIPTNFLPLINIKPSVISPEGHTLIIDLIPFGHGSFDVIVGMDWLSKLRAKIVCYEKILQNPLSNGKNLEVHGERPEGNMKQLKTMKANEPKLEDIPVVYNFLGVFLEDLSGLPLSRDVEFRIDLIPEAMPIAKSTYHVTPTKMQELSNQLKEIQEKGFI
ncbi:putative reverse transcriptase domain-containing protein [Tanacetum coccineum]